jgi:hypothetical protein
MRPFLSNVCVTFDPVPARYFALNQTGTVYVSSKKINAFYDDNVKSPVQVLR